MVTSTEMDEDIVVGVFGWHKTGGLYVLRQFGHRPIPSTALSTNAGYGRRGGRRQRSQRASIFALTAQHHERLERYDFGNGQFNSRTIFKAARHYGAALVCGSWMWIKIAI